MTVRDQLNKALRDLGIETTGTFSEPIWRSVGDTATDLAPAVEAMVAEAVAAEREACAACADSRVAYATKYYQVGEATSMARAIAQDIRSRAEG